MVLSLTAAVWADGVTGKWKVTANAPDGNTYNVDLVVKDEGGKLAAALESERGTMPLQEVAFNNGELTFKLEIGSGPIPFKLKVDGDTLKGTLTAPDGTTGSVTGKRDGAAAQAASAAAAQVAGKWKIESKDAEGNTMRVTIELQQDGEKLTGQVTTENGDVAPIADGKISGSEFSFKIQADGEFVVKGTVSESGVKGTYTTPNGSKGTFTGTK
jgi:hypothetical protein